MYTYIYIHTCIHTCLFVRVCTCSINFVKTGDIRILSGIEQVYIYMYIHTHIHIHINIHTHTCIHIDTYI